MCLPRQHRWSQILCSELLRAPTVSGPPFVTWVERPVSVTLPLNQNSCGTVFLSKIMAYSQLCRVDPGSRQLSPLPPDHVVGTVLGPMEQSLCPSHRRQEVATNRYQTSQKATFWSMELDFMEPAGAPICS